MEYTAQCPYLIDVHCAEEEGVQEEEEAISTGAEAVMEYTAQLLAVMQGQAEERGGVATLGRSSCAVLYRAHSVQSCILV